jgi:hypothetical protein
MRNTQTLQIFTKIVKTESIYKSNSNAKLEGLVDKTKWGNARREEVRALLINRTLIRVENVSLEQISTIDLNHYQVVHRGQNTSFCCKLSLVAFLIVIRLLVPWPSA